MKRKPFTIIAATLLVGASAVSSANPSPKCSGVHTWHHISAMEGTWLATLTVINEHGGFVDEKCRSVTQFKVNANTSKQFGMKLNLGSDFNFTYTLALAKQPDHFDPFRKQPICHYLISAYAPGKPQVIMTPMNNAQCLTSDDGTGVDFVVG